MSKACGCSMGLVAFALALLVGAVADHSVEVVLGRGLVALAVFFFIGQVAGLLVNHMLRQHYERRMTELEPGAEPSADGPGPKKGEQAAASAS